MIVFGWLFTVIGVIGGVVSYIMYRNEYSNYGKRIENFWEGRKQEYEIYQIVMIAAIGLFVLGLTLLIIGYVKKSRSTSDIIVQPLTPPQPPVQPIDPPSVQPKTDNLDKLLKLKELLDSGVITQEEFDRKKKEYLGL